MNAASRLAESRGHTKQKRQEERRRRDELRRWRRHTQRDSFLLLQEYSSSFISSFSSFLWTSTREEERRRILNFHPDFDKWQGNKLNFSFETCSFFFFPTLLCCILNDRWFKHNMRKKWVQNKMKNQKGLNLCSKTSLVLVLLVFF